MSEPIVLRFETKLSREDSARLWGLIAKLPGPRACRTCDYGDSPSCNHEARERQVCQAPEGNFGCSILPCLGACSTP